MKIFFLWLIFFGMAVSFFSCNKEILDNKVNPMPEKLSITVIAHAPSLNTDFDTRSYIGTYEGTSNTILWGRDEALKIGVLGDGEVNKVTWATQTTSAYDGLPTASFSFSVTPVSNSIGSAYTYIGIYPASASLDDNSVVEHRVNLKTIQYATAVSYDPGAYILIAKPDAGHNSSNANWEASFRRATALNKLTLKNIPEPIESVEIIAPSGKTLSGNRYMDLSTGNSGSIYQRVNTVTVNYGEPNSGIIEDDINCKAVWFTSWGVEITEGEELTIIARSATKYYKRVITARAEGILFREGYLNTLGVNMASADIVYKNYSFGLQSQNVVYDNSSHAAFTSLYDNNGTLLMAFREGTAHRPASESEYGCVKVLSKNGADWPVSATISDATKDLRDPFITEVDGHMRMYIGYNTFEQGAYQHSGTVYSDYINGNWSEVKAVNHDLGHIAWLWKVRKHNYKYYSVAYLEGEKPALLVSDNGIDWSTLTIFDLDGILTEADMCFIDETVYVCLRKDTPVSEPAYWGVASYPFTDFSWREMERHIESPELLWLPYAGKLLLAGRDVKENGEINVTLFSASFDGSLEEISIMETSMGGDKGYPGLAYRDGMLYCGWYSGSKSASSISVTTWNVEEQ